MSSPSIVPPSGILPLPIPPPLPIPSPLPFPSPLPEDALLAPWWRLPDELRVLFESADTRGAAKAPELTDRDRDILRSCALAVRRARRMTKGDDEEKIQAARRQLLAVGQYVIGFCDAKGLSVGLSGLASIAAKQPESVELEPALDAFEAILQDMCEPTRIGLLLAAGLATVALGVVCKMAASQLPE